jgi:hypothetical protein
MPVCQPERASTFVISITPFAADGSIDEAAVRGHFRRLAASGIGVYVGGGGSGEGYTLSRADNERLFAIAVEELKGKVPCRAMGVEPRTAAQMTEFLGIAAAAGMEAAQVYSLDVGHAHVPTPGELDAYFSAVMDAAEIPMVLSTHQSVGYRIPPELVVSLAQHEGVVGVNCTHPDLGYLATVVDGVAAVGGQSGAEDLRAGGEVLRGRRHDRHDGGLRQGDPAVERPLRQWRYPRDQGSAEPSGPARRLPAPAPPAGDRRTAGPGAGRGEQHGPGRAGGLVIQRYTGARKTVSAPARLVSASRGDLSGGLLAAA